MSATPSGRLPRIHPYAPPLYVALLYLAQRGTLPMKVQAIEDELKELPRWRWIRRLHVERQLFVAQLALECWQAGRERPA